MSPQGQLCVSLNRPVVFAKCIHSVASVGDHYGYTSSHTERDRCENVSLLSHVAMPESSVASAVVSQPCNETSYDGHISSREGELTVAEGRSILLTGLLANVLRVSGCSVNCVNCIPFKVRDTISCDVACGWFEVMLLFHCKDGSK